MKVLCYTSAEQTWNEVLASDTACPDCYYQRALCRARRPRLDDGMAALADLERAFALDPALCVRAERELQLFTLRDWPEFWTLLGKEPPPKQRPALDKRYHPVPTEPTLRR